MSPTIGAVTGEVDVEHHFALQTKRLAVWQTQRRARRHDQNAAVVVAETELVRRAQHALRLDAENRTGFDDPAIGHGGAWRGERNDVVGLHVECAAPHVALDTVARIDPDAMHLGRVRMTLGAQHSRRDDAVDG